MSALYFFDTSGVFSAMLPAVMAHELGHVIALRICGARVTRLRLGIEGLSMDYAGALSHLADSFCALMGPIFGAVFAILTSMLGNRLDSGYLLCVSGVSAVLSAFNLLPVPALDGGRALSAVLPEKISVVLGMLVGCVLLLSGLYCAVKGYGLALLPAGAWTLVCTWRWKPQER